MLNDSYFLKNMVVAPVEQLNIPLRDIKKIFSLQQKIITDEVDEKGEIIKQKQVYRWPAADRLIREIQLEKEILNCVFCDTQKNIVLTFPVFEIDEDRSFIKLINMKHACKNCQQIVKVNPSSDKAVSKRIAFILSGFERSMYKRDMSPDEMISHVRSKRAAYSKKGWDWDLTYLYRRSFSNIRIYSSRPVDEYKNVDGRPFVPWSGVSSTDEYLALDGKQGRVRVVKDS